MMDKATAIKCYGVCEVTDDSQIDDGVISFLYGNCKDSRHYLFIKDAARDLIRKQILEDLEALQARSKYLNADLLEDDLEVLTIYNYLRNADYQHPTGRYTRGQNRFTIDGMDMEQFCSGFGVRALIKLSCDDYKDGKRYDMLEDHEFMRLYLKVIHSLTRRWHEMDEDLIKYVGSFEKMYESPEFGYCSYYKNNASQIKPIPKKSKTAFFSA